MDSKIIKSFVVRNWIWLLPILPALLLNVVLYAHQGVRITFDSHQFLCAASSFRHHGHLLVCDGKPMVLSAPFFSVLLSIFAEPVKVYSAVSPFLYWLTLSCWLYVLKGKVLGSLWAPWSILLGLPLFLPFLFLWSEGPFLALFSIGVLGLEKSRAGANRCYLWATFFCFSLAVGFRYAGLFIIVPMLVWEFFEHKAGARTHLILILGAVLLVVVAMAIRNWHLSHTFSGMRGEASGSFLQVLSQCGIVIANWLVPVSTMGNLAIVLLVCLLVIAVQVDYKNVSLLVIYFIMMVVSAAFSDIEHDERLFVPVYPLFAISVSRLFFKKEVSQWAFLVGLFWVAYLVVRYVKNIFFWWN